MRLKLLTAALTLSALPWLAHGEDLVQAYQEALANNPTLAQSNAQYLGARENIRQAWGQLLPQINGSFGISQVNGMSTRGSDRQTSYSTVTDASGASILAPDYGSGLSNGFSTGHTRRRQWDAQLSQTLVNFAQFATVGESRASTRASEQDYQTQLLAMTYNVASAYLNVLNAQEQLRYAQANADSLKSAYDQADQQFKLGLVAIQNALQAKSSYLASLATISNDQATLKDAREALTQLTGHATGNLLNLREDLPLTPPQPADEQAWVQRALTSNPQLLSAQYSVQAAEKSIDVARAGHLPTLNASVDYNNNNGWYHYAGSTSSNPRHGATTIGVTLNVPIFSGGITQSKVRQAIYQRDASADNAEVTRRTVIRDTLNDYRQTIASINNVQSNQAAVEASLKSRDAVKAGYQVGTEDMVSVLSAQSTLFQSQSNYATSRYQYVSNQLELKKDAGTLGLADLQQVNALLQAR